MTLVWDKTPEDALEELVAAYIDAIRAAVRDLVHHYAGEIENYMKANAPWTDRTGNARQTLSAEVEQLAVDMWSILLAGGVDYFVWLELAHQGRYAIIGPTLDLFGPRIWADVRRLFQTGEFRG